MDLNTTIMNISLDNDDSPITLLRSCNFLLSCIGLAFNSFLLIILLLVGRRQCATYFLLILMTLCDLLYCLVYVTIVLTVDQYINLINHQILCPLSFFLTPFAFTGSTLLLLICLLHFATSYVRKYETVLGQIGGRLSVVFVLAFLIIRSVLGSTSIELVIPNQNASHIRYCTIDMNTSPIVTTVQNVNHIFAEVTDILIYVGWITILLLHTMSMICCKRPFFCSHADSSLAAIIKPVSFAAILLRHSTDVSREQQPVDVTIELSGMFDLSNETMLSGKRRHKDVSSIILSIGVFSIILYLPIMFNKYATLYFVYGGQTLLTNQEAHLLQLLQHSAHLFCLSIRFLPYLLFDKRILGLFHQLMGIKCMKSNHHKRLSRKQKYRTKQKYTCSCQWYRREQTLKFDTNNGVEL